MFHKKAFRKHFAIFKGKHLCWSFFLIKLQAGRSPTKVPSGNIAKFLRTPVLKNICERLFLIKVCFNFFRDIARWNKSNSDLFYRPSIFTDHRPANTIHLFVPTKRKYFGSILPHNKSQQRGISQRLFDK